MKFNLLLMTLLLAFSYAAPTSAQITYTPYSSVVESDSWNNSDTQIPLEIIPFHDNFPDGE